MGDFVKARRTGPTTVLKSGMVTRGGVYDVPREYLDAGGWEPVRSTDEARKRVTEPASTPSVGELTVKQLRERLTALDVSVPEGARKDDLIQLLEAHNGRD